MDDAGEILNGIRAWVEHESFTADADDVTRLIQAAGAQFHEAGAQVEQLPGRDGYGDHMRAVSAWGDSQTPGVLVLCHLDTVHPKGTLASDLPFRIDGDKAFGPGIYDMKGGAYLAYAAWRDIAQSGTQTPLPIRFLVTSDEEVGSPTSADLIRQEGRRAKYVLVTEPARDGGRIVTARKGVSRYTIKAYGRPAHAGARHAEGRNAILELARQIERIQAMTDYARGLTFNVGTIRGGTAENVVPQYAEASIDSRALTMADAEDADRRLKSLEPFDADVRIEVTGGINRPPYEKDAKVEALFKTAQDVARGIGFELMDTATGGGSDGNFLAHDVACLDGLGADGDGAHTLQEHVHVPSLVPRKQLLQGLMVNLS